LAFVDLVSQIRTAVRSRALVVAVPPRLALAASGLIGWAVGDVVLTHDEITELRSELLVSSETASCPTPFRAWIEANAATIGRQYSSERARNYRNYRSGAGS